MGNQERTLLWFRNDLRVQDNSALEWAEQNGAFLVPIFLFHQYTDELGGASKWWLHFSLSSLAKSLNDLGSQLCLYRGDPLSVIAKLCELYAITTVVWNREYEPSTITRDKEIKAQLERQGVRVHSFAGNILKEPWRETKKDGTPYKVFTPFWKTLHAGFEVLEPLAAPSKLPPLPYNFSRDGEISLAEARLCPQIPWDQGFYEQWPDVSESGAHQRLGALIRGDTHVNYDQQRNFPAVVGTTLLSPFLRWGQITAQRIWWELEQVAGDKQEQLEPLLRQLGWRDFANSLIYHFPDSITEPLNSSFKGFAWLDPADSQDQLRAWQQGVTGYPIVDAGMRQLWATGWMHNRVRMIVGSFLVKHLLIHWRYGLEWFWDTLVDADLANNTMGWQWIAGCGADAAPYFRIFNPMSRGEKFDANGDYVRRWVPELKQLPSKYIHRPWEAPELVMRTAGVVLGKEYPRPIVSHEEGRTRALRTYQMSRV